MISCSASRSISTTRAGESFDFFLMSLHLWTAVAHSSSGCCPAACSARYRRQIRSADETIRS
jgi:hypothetical protein